MAGKDVKMLKELQDDERDKKTLKLKLKEMRKRKKDRRIEEDMGNPSMKQVCLEILNRDTREWDVKRRRINEKLKEIDEEEEREAERMKRRAIGEQKRKILLKSMRRRGTLKPTEEEKRKIEIRKEYWRRFREKTEEDEGDDEDVTEAGEAKKSLTGCIASATASSSISPPSTLPLGTTGKDIEYPETICLKNSKLTLKSPKITPISTINDTKSQEIPKSDSNDSNGEKGIQNCHSQMKRHDINGCDSNGEKCNSKSDSDKI